MMKNLALPCTAFTVLLMLSSTSQADENKADDVKVKQPVVLEAVKVEDARVEETVAAKRATIGVLGELPLIEAPYSVNVINQHLIDIQQSTRYTDYLKNVPGANVGNVAIGFFSLRGFSVGGDGYLYDGLPGHVGLSETYQLDGFDRIEVYKGPGAFLSGFGGSTSLGGTLNYVPKRAGEEPVRSAEATYTNRSLFSVGADVGERFGSNKQFGYRLNARFRDGEQQAERYDWTQKAASLALDWRPTSDLSLAANLEYADNHLPELPPFLVLSPGLSVPRAPKASNNVALSWDEFAATGKTGYLRADWKLAELWTLTAQALHSESKRPNEKGARSGLVTDEDGSVTLGGFVERSENKTNSGQILLRGKFQTGPLQHQLTTGGTALADKSYGGFADLGAFDSNIYSPVDSPEPADINVPLELSGKTRSSSLLLSDIVDLSSQWSVLLAARHAKYEDRLGDTPTVSKTSPTFALMFKPVTGSLIYFNYAEGLEQGSTVESGLENQGEKLPPLVTEQMELGAKLEREGVTYTLALFDLKQPSEFVIPPADPDDPNSLGRRVQDGEQHHRGVEIAANGRLLPNLEIAAGLALIDPKAEETGDPENDGKRPPSVPRMTTNLFVDYGIRTVPGLFVNAGMYHNAKQFLDSANTQQLKGWTRYDIGARYETIIGQTAASFLLGIENLADKDYWIGQTGVLTIADPLTIKLSARFDL